MDYTTAVFNVVWALLVFIIVNFFPIAINFKIGIFIVFYFPLLLFSFFGFNNEKESDQTVFNSDNYVSALENRLSKTLSEVDGAGKVSVIITVESGLETIIATEKTISETNGSKETVESPIIVNGKTVVLKELYPKISGVVIVAEGADNIAVMQKIQQAFSDAILPRLFLPGAAAAKKGLCVLPSGANGVSGGSWPPHCSLPCLSPSVRG